MKTVLLEVLILVCTGIMIVDCSKHDYRTTALKDNIDFTDPQSVRNSRSFGVGVDGWMGNEAELMLGNPTHQPAILLEGTNVQTIAGDEVLPLMFLVGPDTVHVSKITTLGDFREFAILPQKVRDLDTLELRLFTTKGFVPSKLGTSNDDRLLSFRLRRVSLVPLDNARIMFPTSFEFPGAAESNPNLQGVYSDGWMADSASVTLFNTEHKETVEIRGLVPGDIFRGVATLDVLFGGITVVKEQVRGNFRLRFQLPELAQGVNRLTFTLKPIGSFVPADRGISGDRRRLSYHLQYVGLK